MNKSDHEPSICMSIERRLTVNWSTGSLVAPFGASSLGISMLVHVVPSAIPIRPSNLYDTGWYIKYHGFRASLNG
ncbi:hypothetical protein BpHYR1_016941 [Brachionus plicatilis]|uniref:Uncharacterized protein n=1 Tax=Brachionus plicatilis TaxID=10195 RepID=A0A3M7SRV4_BRAPC|nr:hypothetical protein BpHYR1_016941 [Brachionus plicatilis]